MRQLSSGLASQSFGYILCNSLRAGGALGGFLVAFFSLKLGGAPEYGLFLFASSLVGLVPEYFSSLAVAEFLNRYSLALKVGLEALDQREHYRRYQEFFNLFFLSCIVSALLLFFIPHAKLNIGIAFGFWTFLFIYSRQHLLVFAEKARLLFSAPLADFVQYLCPPFLWISCLLLLHIVHSRASLDSSQIAMCGALAYGLPLLFVSLIPSLSSASQEKFFLVSSWPGLIKRNLLSRGEQSLLFGDLSWATLLSHFVSRTPSIFLGYFASAISSVAVYGVLQRIQYLVLIPSYSFLSFNARSLAEVASRGSRHRFGLLCLGITFVASASTIAFWLLSVGFPDQVSWLFTKKGIGVDINSALLALALVVAVGMALQSFAATSLTALGQFGLFRSSQLLRFVVLVLLFGSLVFVARVSVFSVYCAEALAMAFSLILVFRGFWRGRRIFFSSTEQM